MNEKTWTLRPFPPEQEEQKELLRRRFDLPPVVAQLLVLRNLRSEEEAERFLYGRLQHLPDPFLLPEMERAVVRLSKALEKKEKVLLFGDYDVDGITATAQLHLFLREIGLRTETLLPHRIHEGYGLTERSVRKIVARKPDLLITIDNGTNARQEIQILRENGIDVIVIDHHETPPSGSGIPAVTLLNPKDPASRFKDREIASAGLVFLFLMAIRSRCRERGITPLPNLKRYLDLASLGTIADVVPLTGTNRLLVRYGLEELASTTRPGLQALAEVASVRPPVGVGAVSFRLAPRLNAAGRLADPQLALDLLLSEEGPVASSLAMKLDELNRQRQGIEEKVLSEAIRMVERDQQSRRGIVVAGTGWHPGVIGIVAARLTERFGRPAVVLALSEEGTPAMGSARTVPGLSVYRALKRIEGEMVRFGGHDAAAGMTLSGDNLERFAQKFDHAVREEWPAEWGETFSPKLTVDAMISLREINTPLVKWLSLLGPHGPGNPEPVLMVTGVRLESCRVVGGDHLKAILCQKETRMDAIGFGWAHFLDPPPRDLPHNVAFSPQINEWNGIENVQIKIKSLVLMGR